MENDVRCSSTTRKMEKPKCESHPEQDLLFECLKCHEMLCRDCKLTEHEGHYTRDIHKVAGVALGIVRRLKEDLDINLSQVQLQIQRMADSEVYFQKSKKLAEKTIHERADKIIAWVNKCRERKLAGLRDLTSTNQDVTDRLLEKENRLFELIYSADGAINAAEYGDYFHTVDVHNYMKKYGPGKDPVTDEPVKLPRYFSQVLLNTEDTAQYQSSIDCFIGFPVMSQVSGGYRAMTVMKQFQCCNDSSTTVLDICPMENHNIAIAYQTNAKGTVISIYTPGGVLLREERIIERERVTISNVFSNWLLVIGSSLQRTFDLSRCVSGYRDPTVPVNSRISYNFRKTDAPGRFAVYKETKSLQTFTSPVFHIFANNPLKVCGNSTGQHFAVIHHSKGSRVIVSMSLVPDEVLCVSLFKKPQPMPSLTWSATVPVFQPSDICFSFLEDREMLLVADSGNHNIKVFEFQTGFEMVGILAEGCPLVRAPTALSVDCVGQLWIGCRKGAILKCQENNATFGENGCLEPTHSHPDLSPAARSSEGNPGSEVPRETATSTPCRSQSYTVINIKSEKNVTKRMTVNTPDDSKEAAYFGATGQQRNHEVFFSGPFADQASSGKYYSLKSPESPKAHDK